MTLYGDPQEPPDVPDDEIPDCMFCGAEMEWERCAACDGAGEFDYDTLSYLDPLWYQPGDWEWCEECEGVGGWWQCPNVPHTPIAPPYEA